jgi:predicted nucleotidyltransferase
VHVEVFRVAGVGTAIFERPRPLSRHRRADPGRVVRYTLNCEEPRNVWAQALGDSSPMVHTHDLLKIAALHDRLAWNQLKDAQDLAVVRRWYLGSTYLADRLYDEDLLPVLLAEGVDPSLALMRLWGQVCAALLGVEERRILLDQWSVCVSPLERVWAAEKRDRVWRAQAVALVEAFDRGIRAT